MQPDVHRPGRRAAPLLVRNRLTPRIRESKLLGLPLGQLRLSGASAVRRVCRVAETKRAGNGGKSRNSSDYSDYFESGCVCGLSSFADEVEFLRHATSSENSNGG